VAMLRDEISSKDRLFGNSCIARVPMKSLRSFTPVKHKYSKARDEVCFMECFQILFDG
jgi:hypothetical protein